MTPVENNINLLIAELKNNRIEKDDALEYIGQVFRTITTNNVASDQRVGAALTVNEFLKKARSNNFHRAEGFYGNLAKFVEEKDQDVGC